MQAAVKLPGARPMSQYLHADRQSWAGVIVSAKGAEGLGIGLSASRSKVETDFGAKELHFTDIYSGHNEFKDVPIADRYEDIEVVANLCALYDVPIFYQTFSPEFLDENPTIRDLGRVGDLDYSKHKDVGLVLLVFQIIQYMRGHPADYTVPVMGWLDAGWKKAGSTLSVSTSDVIVDGKLTFIDSHDSPFDSSPKND